MGFMLFYLLVVYVWSLNIYPMGRDYETMAHPENLPWGAEQLFRWEMRAFGAFVPGYHIVNCVLLYACMVALFFFTRFTVRGPWWLGSLAAVLMMANPVKSEAVLNLSGIAELLPAFLALTALALYAWEIMEPRWWKLLLSMAMLVLASWPFRCNALLFLVCLLSEWLVAEKAQRARLRMVLVLAAGLPAVRTLWPIMPMLDLAPLFFILYPIGLLPETVHTFHTFAMVGCFAAVPVLLGLAWKHRKQRSPLLFGLLAACAFRFYQGSPSFDPVHLLGGGVLIVPIGLINIAVAALCRRIIQHPKWHRPMVFLTSVLCLLFFGLQIQANLIWQYAGNQVRAFQHAAQACRRQNGLDTKLGILPDYEYFLGAPMMLSESIKYDTPFSARIDATSLLRLSRNPGQRFTVTIPSWSPDEGTVLIEGVSLEPYTYDPRCTAISAEGNAIRLHFSGKRGALPPLIPFTLSRSRFF